MSLFYTSVVIHPAPFLLEWSQLSSFPPSLRSLDRTCHFLIGNSEQPCTALTNCSKCTLYLTQSKPPPKKNTTKKGKSPEEPRVDKNMKKKTQRLAVTLAKLANWW